MRKLVAAAVTAVVAFSAVPNAMAYDGRDLNNASITNAKSVYAENEGVHLVADGLKKNTRYIVGQCSWKSHRFLFFPVPACVQENVVKATTDANGHLSATVYVLSNPANAHHRLPGQPAKINFSTGGADSVKAELVVIQDHGRGFRGFTSADSLETFNVNK